MQGSRYTDEQRRQAVVAYQVWGSFSKIEQELGIPETTVGLWRRSEWWDQLAAEVCAEASNVITASVTRIAKSALEELEDRVKNGDAVLVKVHTEEGIQTEQVRVPMKGKDLAITAAIMIDKRQLMLSRPTSISARASDLADQLRAWMQQQAGRVIESSAAQQQDE